MTEKQIIVEGQSMDTSSLTDSASAIWENYLTKHPEITQTLESVESKYGSEYVTLVQIGMKLAHFGEMSNGDAEANATGKLAIDSTMGEMLELVKTARELPIPDIIRRQSPV